MTNADAEVIVTVKEFTAEPREVRRDLLNGYEAGQRLGVLKRKIVYLDLATEADVKQIMAIEFPGAFGGQGAYFFESRSDQEIFGHCSPVMNVVLTGSCKLPSET